MNAQTNETKAPPAALAVPAGCEWVSRHASLPTKEDADANGDVLWTRSGAVMPCRWDKVPIDGTVWAKARKAQQPAAAVPAGWRVESLGELDIRVTSPSGEKWRLSDDDHLSGFFYRFLRAMLAAAERKEGEP